MRQVVVMPEKIILWHQKTFYWRLDSLRMGLVVSEAGIEPATVSLEG